MSEIKWTDAQKRAIEHKEGSVIVSAAAGSGKTAVLVERIIRLIATCDIDSMLIVTFTNAAAANMKQSIHKAILKKLSNPASSKESEHYTRQLSLLGNANITTLHAFCSRFVREHFAALSLSPAVKLGDQTQLTLMLSDAVEQSIEEGYAEQDKEFMQFAAESVSKTNDSLLHDICISLYHFLMALPNPEKWLSDATNLYANCDVNRILSAPFFKNHITELCSAAYETAKQNRSAVHENEDYLYALPVMEADFAFAEQLKEKENDFEALFDFIRTDMPKGRVQLAKKTVPAEVSDALRAMREPFKAALQALSNDAEQFNSTALREFLDLQAPQIRAISKRVMRTIEIYNAAKAEKDILDFNDLEHLTIRLLYENDEITPLAQTAASGFSHVIVDEYQDTNLVQEAILTALSQNGKNLFMVGDIKQSIYGFRNTVPELFSDKVERYSDEKNDGTCVYLSENFRSRGSVLTFANLIFSTLMSKSVGGSPYTEQEALHQRGAFPETNEKAEVYILKDELFKGNEIEGEALFCAQKINEMIAKKQQVTDSKTGELRDITYRDIVILTRSAKHIASVFCTVFAACGIPVYCDDFGETFLESMEIQSLTAFLRVMDNPLQDIFLLSAFTSPLFGKPDADLVVRARLLNQNVPLYTCFKRYPKDESGYDKIQEFLDFVQYWREKAQALSVSDLLSLFMAETGFSEYMESLSGGEQRLSNIRHFQLLAQSYPGAETGGLYAFLNYIEKHRDSKSGLMSPKTLPENTNMVQISTIHKSKGLEYPVVILADTSASLTGKDRRDPIFCHRDVGFALSYRNTEKNIKIDSPVRELIQKIKSAEEISEELRILYVALTRAKDKMIVTGFVKNEKRFEEYTSKALFSPSKEISPHIVSAANSYLEWICLALKRKEYYESLPVSVQEITKITVPEETAVQKEELLPLAPSSEIREKLEYIYPFVPHTKLFSKISVTELKRLTEEAESDAYKPFYPRYESVSVSDSKNNSAKRGTLTHYILEKLDFSEQTADKTVRNLTESGQISAEEAALLDLSAVNGFLSSSLCKKLQSAKRIQKELSFNVHIDGSLIDESAANAPVQLQGTVDVAAEMPDGTLCVVDFKTDKIRSEEELQQKIKSYTLQMNYYKLGAKKLFPNRKITMHIYFLSIGKDIEI